MDPLPARGAALRSSSLRRPLSLLGDGCRASVEPDGAVRSYDSFVEGRALFGLEQVWFYKIQAGVVVQGARPDWGVRVSPELLQFAGRLFEGVEVVQSVELYEGGTRGYTRKVKVANSGRSAIRLRVIALRDPTAAQFEAQAKRWGSLGVNAFNRGSHVAMDEVTEPPGARVVGSSPAPSKFYLTSNRSRALDAVSTGELPEGTAGMSGQVLVLSSHELDLAPGDGADLTFVSLYSPGKLEDALSEFGRLGSGPRRRAPSPFRVAASDGNMAEAGEWAVPAAESGSYSEDRLDRYEALRGLCFISPPSAKRVIDRARAEMRRDGSLPHSLDPTQPGVLETAVFLKALATHLLLARDRRARRGAYPTVKKIAGYLLSISKDSVILPDPGLPQGWRREIGRGYPTGEIPEVSLAVSGALGAAAEAARAVSRGSDAGRFRERAEMIAERVRRKMVDEKGSLCLSIEAPDRPRWDETVDVAVAAYRRPFMKSAEQGAIHRLLEKDFDTPYGPRCVPTTNQVYFNRAYGSGQLGGVWTRAAMAYASVCYRAGLPGLGSISLAKSARLVSEQGGKVGGSPGEFPLWVDADAGEAHGEGSDPVSAARFVEAVLEGELGLVPGPDGLSIAPPSTSSFGWVFAQGVWGGEEACAFVGRGGGRTHHFAAGGAFAGGAVKFAGCEPLEAPRSVAAVSLHTPGQVVLLGNSSRAPVRFRVSVPPRAPGLAQKLTATLESFDPETGGWGKTGSVRVFPAMDFDASLGGGEWKAFRVSTA